MIGEKDDASGEFACAPLFGGKELRKMFQRRTSEGGELGAALGGVSSESDSPEAGDENQSFGLSERVHVVP